MNYQNLKKKNQGNSNFSRRRFLGTTATAAAAFTIIPRYVMGGRGIQLPAICLMLPESESAVRAEAISSR